MDDDVLRREAERRERAADVISSLDLLARWKPYGEPHLVGAAAYGLMVSPDVDLEIYCAEPRVESGFAVVSELARIPGVSKIRFSNELRAADDGLYWQVRFRPGTSAEVWKIDMWLLADDHAGPRSLDLAHALAKVLTDELRVAILTIKESAAGREDVRSIDVYEAVVDGGVRSPAQFADWLSARTPALLSAWLPAHGVSDPARRRAGT